MRVLARVLHLPQGELRQLLLERRAARRRQARIACISGGNLRTAASPALLAAFFSIAAICSRIAAVLRSHSARAASYSRFSSAVARGRSSRGSMGAKKAWSR